MHNNTLLLAYFTNVDIFDSVLGWLLLYSLITFSNSKHYQYLCRWTVCLLSDAKCFESDAR